MKLSLKKKSSLLFLISAALFALFIIFTVLVAFCDKATVTYNEKISSEVGFAGINQAFFKTIGENPFWYDFTEFLGMIALCIAGIFALIGLFQLATHKRFWAVDRELLLLGVFYVLVALFYVLFELIVVNYRPVLVGGALEASYPSSHTMLACCIFVTAPFACGHCMKSRVTYLTVTVLCFFFALITVIGRLLSGVHWLTDIVGALLLSASLILLYIAALTLSYEKTKHQKRHHHSNH